MKLGFPVTTNFWVCGEEKDSRGFQVKDFCVCSDTTNFWAQRKKSLLNEKAKDSVCRERRRRMVGGFGFGLPKEENSLFLFYF
jgi:hypothetical protein